MKWSETFIPTLKEIPKGTEAVSHQLMLRAGLIRQISSGTYSYLPLGLRILKKVEAIIREEMDREGANEVLLPALQPVELWWQSGRYEAIGKDLFSFKDRHKRQVVLGPTHEEVITNLVKDEVKSYRQLPLILYQLQTKFRDEPRPRFGVIRSKEFIMKDAYSFDENSRGLDESYQRMHRAYVKIFSRCGLNCLDVEADPGIMGGGESCEFMVPSGSGEDLVALCQSCGYGATLEKAGCQRQEVVREKPRPLEEAATPGARTIEEVSRFLKIPPQKMVKTLIYETTGGLPGSSCHEEKPGSKEGRGEVFAALVRGDHTINETKLLKLLGVKELKLANESLIRKVTEAPLGFSGPVGLKDVKIVSDWAVMSLSNFVSGANKEDKHLVNLNPVRDFKSDVCGDIRYIVDKDPCPKCKAPVAIKRTIEIGHIFKLGARYSNSLGANFLNRKGEEKPVIMGCYGIGVNRIAAASIEQNHDEDGIIWPLSISPYPLLILPLAGNNPKIMDYATELYEELSREQIESLLDDRDESPGIKFKDADLIGIPLRVTIGSKSLAEGKVEIYLRKTKEVITVEKDKVVDKIKELLSGTAN